MYSFRRRAGGGTRGGRVRRAEFKQRRGVKAAGGAENRLRLAHQRRHLEQRAGRNARAASERRDTAFERFDTGFATNTATGRNVEIALEPLAESGRRHVEDNVKRIGIRASLRIAQTANLA